MPVRIRGSGEFEDCWGGDGNGDAVGDDGGGDLIARVSVAWVLAGDGV